MSRSPLPPVRLPARAAALGLVVLLAGCASKSPPPYSQVGAPVAQAAVPAPIPNQVEIEDDGLPVQTPPVRRARAVADDPSEPYSPNYGSRRAATAEPARTVGRVVAGPSTHTRRSAAVGHDANFDPDGVIARAILEHEKRVQ